VQFGLERELVSIEPKLVLPKQVSAISRNALSYALLVFILIALSLAYFHSSWGFGYIHTFHIVIAIVMSTSETPNPGHPEGAGGKDTQIFAPHNEGLLSDEYASRIASSLAKNVQKRVNLHDKDVVEAENIARAERNLRRAHLRTNEDHIK
jgi:hypothetical protein